MAFCPKCGNQLDENVKFCSVCGEPTGEQQPAAPTYTAPQQPYQAPQQPYQAPYQAPYQQPYQAPYQAPYQQPVQEAPNKAKGFVGMALAIVGLFMSVLCFIEMYPYLDYSYYYDSYVFGLTIGFGIFSLPLSIVGKSLASRSAEEGNTSGACSAGKAVGIVGIVCSALLMFIGFVNMVA